MNWQPARWDSTIWVLDDAINSHGCAEPPNGINEVGVQNFEPLQVIGNEIRFYMPEREAVNLRVYNLCGRLESELINGALDKGEHIIKIPAVRNGIYFVRLNCCVGGTSKSRYASYTAKFVVIK